MTTTATPQVPVTEMSRPQADEALADVRRQLADRDRARYADPDAYARLDQAGKTAHNVEGVALLDREAALLKRLRILDNQEAAAEQAAEPRSDGRHHGVELPPGVPPEAISPALLTKYEVACLAVSEGKTGAAGRLAQVEAEIEKAATEHRRAPAAEAARKRREAEEAEAARVLAEGEADKRRTDRGHGPGRDRPAVTPQGQRRLGAGRAGPLRSRDRSSQRSSARRRRRRPQGSGAVLADALVPPPRRGTRRMAQRRATGAARLTPPAAAAARLTG